MHNPQEPSYGPNAKKEKERKRLTVYHCYRAAVKLKEHAPLLFAVSNPRKRSCVVSYTFNY